MQAYIKSKNTKKKLIQQYAYLVTYIAKKILRRVPPNVLLDELISAGNLGLIDAVGKFDESKNVALQTYAKYRIKGAILDELRSMDWYSRSMRKKIQQIENAVLKIEQKKNAPADNKEIAKYLGINIDEYHKILKKINYATVLSLDCFVHNSKSDSNNQSVFKNQLKGKEENSPEKKYELAELKSILTKTIKTLSKNEQLILSMYYFDELTLKEIGEVLNLTESRICQIHTKLLLKLKTKMAIFYTKVSNL